jgi:hypothetical protein
MTFFGHDFFSECDFFLNVTFFVLDVTFLFNYHTFYEKASISLLSSGVTHTMLLVFTGCIIPSQNPQHVHT